MNPVIERALSRLKVNNLIFTDKPILIGGMAMEYYSMRKSGADIDLVISNKDYINLAEKHLDKRKDIYSDMGVVVGEFKIWRSINLLDYDFYLKDANDEESLFVVSLDRLLFMRVCAMNVEKYKNDLIMMRDYYNKQYCNQEFLHESQIHAESYRKSGGTIFGGKYMN